ncbi:MAG TPA: metallophosphoesterase family protein [Pirellulales bacterium]|jgi:3',5'-cyclic AMP phosphodiesterase CpdA|nr:metallophosphoesterase family protein [Pirellulales bacterium]
MLTLLQISDLHFGPPYRPEVGDALLRAAADIRPDVIVASGDFTQRAKADQFAAARAFLDRLPAVAQIVVPGNHDIPLYRVYERLVSPYGLYRQYISPELDTVLARDDATIVALNTTAPLRRITDGRIQPWQLDFASRAFQAAPAHAAKIVVAHHHLAPAPDSERKRDATLGAREALDCFRRLGVELILGGHLHRSYTASSHDAFAPADHPPAGDTSRPGDGFSAGDSASGILIVECGTSTSSRGRGRERHKNSLNVIQIDDRTTTVTHWLFSTVTGSFAPASQHVYPRRGGLFSGPPVEPVGR